MSDDHERLRDGIRRMRCQDDILVEELAENAPLGLLVRHALTTHGILIILLLLQRFEGRHPAGAL